LKAQPKPRPPFLSIPETWNELNFFEKLHDSGIKNIIKCYPGAAGGSITTLLPLLTKCLAILGILIKKLVFIKMSKRFNV
jgi:hypothetical protein